MVEFEGSLAAERLATYAHADMQRYREAARRAAGLAKTPAPKSTEATTAAR